MATTYEQVLALLNELAQGQAELLRAQQETDRKFQDTDRKFQETERKFQEMARLVSGLGGQWGLFMENQVALACERVFSERGIPVQMVSQRVKKRRGGDTLEIDVLVVNAGHVVVVVVEVKASLSVEAVREFLDDLRQFRDFSGIRRLAGAWGGGGDAALKAGRIATPTGRDCSSWRRTATR
jgi:hypothetical protein